jgi:hypothetical protein
VVGALLGAGLMFVARKWLGFPMPASLGELSAANTSLGEVASATAGTLGGLAVTSLAFVAAVLGGFYEVDNTPEDAEKTEGGARVAEGSSKTRIGAASVPDDEELEESAPPAQAKKR